MVPSTQYLCAIIVTIIVLYRAIPYNFETSSPGWNHRNGFSRTHLLGHAVNDPTRRLPINNTSSRDTKGFAKSSGYFLAGTRDRISDDVIRLLMKVRGAGRMNKSMHRSCANYRWVLVANSRAW